MGGVKKTMITGNVYQVLKDILGVGQEARWIDGIVQAPPLCCSRVSVATKGS
jgi:predicted Zn-dependent protease